MSTESATRWNVTADEARRELRALLRSVDQERAHVMITDGEEQIAALVPVAFYKIAAELIGEKWAEAAGVISRAVAATRPAAVEEGRRQGNEDACRW